MIVELLEELVRGLESKGLKITDELNPGLTRTEIKLAFPDVTPCDEFIQMYMWSNGCVNGGDLDGLYFRDNGFLSIEHAIRERDSLVPLYAFDDEKLIESRSEYKKWIPFAGFNGVIYLVVCGEHIYGDDLQYPIISVGGGDLNIEYDSLESMIRTNIEWVNHSDWQPFEPMPEGIEQEIWTAHNPGIWERRDRAFRIEVEEARRD